MNDHANVSHMPAGDSVEGAPLNALLETARELVGQEIERGERIESKARNQFAAVGAFFAVSVAAVAAMLSALTTNGHHIQAWIFPVTALFTGVAAVAVLVAFVVSLEAWKTQKSGTISSTTLREYIPHAEKGRAAVVRQLVNGYANILDLRQAANSKRLAALKNATAACIIASIASAGALIVVLVAVGNQ